MSYRPILGQRVLYQLTKGDAEAIQLARNIESVVGRKGNTAREGQYYAADVVRVFGGNPDGWANLKVLLDGNDVHWVTSVPYGDEPGTWCRTAF